MTTSHDLQAETEIRELVDRFHHSLDAGKFDAAWADGFLTDDVSFIMPIGTDQGRDAVTEQTKRGVLAFARTVHFGTNLVIVVVVDGERASVRWNALCTHVHPGDAEDLFVSAGAYHGWAERTQDGAWRFAELALDVAWTRGTPPA
ncbi:nuclear transport factor 2 family protein [Mariniluteicoccus flavus]